MKGFVKIVLLLLGIGLMLGLLSVYVVYWYFSRDLPSVDELKKYKPKVITEIYADDGTLIGELAEEYRKVVPFESIPPYVVKAFLAVEDARFYEHKGLDYIRIAGALYHNLRNLNPTGQGASTITMQLARTFFLSPEKVFSRKFKEMILAWRIDHYLSKDEVLWLYLNQIYLGTVLGRNIYGVETAAEQYFGKSIKEVNLAEAAMIAGLPRWPARYSPVEHFEEAKKRQRLVLRRMVEEKMISEEEAKQAEAEPIVLRVKGNQYETDSAYFIEAVRRYLIERYGEKWVMTQGLKVFTTMNLEMQKAGAYAVRQGLAGPEGLDHRQGYRGALGQVKPEEVEKHLSEQEQALREQWRFRNITSGGDPSAEPPSPIPLTLNQKYRGLVSEVDLKENRLLIKIGLSSGWLPKDNCKWALSGKSLDKVFQPGDLILVSVSEIKDSDSGKEYIFQLEQEPQAEAALLAFSVRTGEIKALIGGYDFTKTQLIRPFQSVRQPGSAIKPLIYAAALNHPTKGITAASIFYDSPDIFEYTQETEDGRKQVTWKPENYAGRFLGPRTLRRALEKSINTISVKIAGEIGLDYAESFVRKLGITSPLKLDLSLALGSSPVSMLELIRAYNVFASGGYLVEPHLIRRIYDRNGNLLELHPQRNLGGEIEEINEAEPNQNAKSETGKEKFKAVNPKALSEPTAEEYLTMLKTNKIPSLAGVDTPVQGTRVISPQLAFLMNNLLEGVATYGTGWRARVLGRPVAGKTGTTNEFRDAWFIGYTPDLICGVWVGFDDNRSLGEGEAGAKAAQPIWIEFMKSALAGKPIVNFPLPEGIEFVKIDQKTGLLASACTEEAVLEAFIAGTAPTQFSPCGPHLKSEDIIRELDR